MVANNVKKEEKEQNKKELAVRPRDNLTITT